MKVSSCKKRPDNTEDKYAIENYSVLTWNIAIITFGECIWSFPKNSVPFFWNLKIILSTAKIFLKLYLLVVLCRKKLKSTFSDLLLKTANKSGCFSAKAFLLRGTATERNACSYTVWRDVSLKFISANKGLPRAILLHDTPHIVQWEFWGLNQNKHIHHSSIAKTYWAK